LWAIPEPFAGHGLTFSPDSKRLATAGTDGVACLWDARTGKQLLQLHGHASNVSDVVFSSDGKLLLTASTDQTTRAWDSASGRLIRVYRGHEAPLVSLALSPDNKRLITLAADDSVKVWDATQDQEARSFVLSKDNQVGVVVSLDFRPGANQLALGGVGVLVWDLASGRQTHHAGEQATFVTHRVAYSADGRRLVSVAWLQKGGFEVTVRDAAAKPRVFNTRTGLIAALSPDGRWLALGGDNKGAGGVVELWDLDAARAMPSLTLGEGRVTALAFSPDGKRLALAVYDGTPGKGTSRVVVKEPASSKHVATLKGSKDDKRLADSVLAALAFTPDGKRLLAAAEKGVYVWDVAAARQVHHFAMNTRISRGAFSAAFSPDSKRLATTGLGGTLALWDVATGQQLLALSGPSSQTDSLAFSPDGTRLAGVGSEGGKLMIKVWDARPLGR
jgi:WD40 repeat protein